MGRGLTAGGMVLEFAVVVAGRQPADALWRAAQRQSWVSVACFPQKNRSGNEARCGSADALGKIIFFPGRPTSGHAQSAIYLSSSSMCIPGVTEPTVHLRLTGGLMAVKAIFRLSIIGQILFRRCAC